jgi:hypothetical protein
MGSHMCVFLIHNNDQMRSHCAQLVRKDSMHMDLKAIELLSQVPKAGKKKATAYL